MKYRILASDMDGTLLTNTKIITEENLTALRRAAAAGMEFIICTGRSFSSLKPYLAQIGFPCWVVTNNGAVIRDKSLQIVTEIPLEQQPLAATIALLETEKIYYHGADRSFTYIESYWRRMENYRNFLRTTGLSPLQTWYHAIYQILIKTTHRKVNLRRYVEQGSRLNSLFLYEADEGKLRRVRERLAQIEGIQITSSGKNNLEILSPLATKGRALAYIAEKMKISPAEIAAVGDQLNDLSMIQFAGLGVAMANGEPEVLAIADWITRSNEEHGVEHLIQTKLL